VIASRERLFPKLRSALAVSIAGYGSLAPYAGQLDRRLGPPGLGVMAGPLGALATGLEAWAKTANELR
jgi:fructokinase